MRAKGVAHGVRAPVEIRQQLPFRQTIELAEIFKILMCETHDERPLICCTSQQLLMKRALNNCPCEVMRISPKPLLTTAALGMLLSSVAVASNGSFGPKA